MNQEEKSHSRKIEELHALKAFIEEVEAEAETIRDQITLLYPNQNRVLKSYCYVTNER